jgi:hypothetical protein
LHGFAGRKISVGVGRDFGSVASCHGLVDAKIDAVGKHPGGAIAKDEVRTGSVTARKIIEVADWTVWNVVRGPEESSPRVGRTIDPTVPVRATQPARTLTHNHGIAQTIENVSGSDDGVSIESPISSIRDFVDFQGPKDTDIVALCNAKQLWSFIDIVTDVFIGFFFRRFGPDFKCWVTRIGGAKVGGYDAHAVRLVPRTIDCKTAVDLGVHIVLFDVGQQCIAPCPSWMERLDDIDPATRKSAIGAFITRQTQSDLPKIVHALGSTRRFSRGLDCGQEQSDQDPDDGDDHQQFYQRKSSSNRRGALPATRVHHVPIAAWLA